MGSGQWEKRDLYPRAEMQICARKAAQFHVEKRVSACQHWVKKSDKVGDLDFWLCGFARAKPHKVPGNGDSFCGCWGGRSTLPRITGGQATSATPDIRCWQCQPFAYGLRGSKVGEESRRDSQSARDSSVRVLGTTILISAYRSPRWSGLMGRPRFLMRSF